MFKGEQRIKGFTLVELAIVLVILGLLIGIGTALMGPLSKQAKYKESQEVVKSAKEAILGNVVKNGFLPMSTAGARSIDSWGRQLKYVKASQFDDNTEDVCGVPSTGISVSECQDDGCGSAIIHNNIGFIVFSLGEDGNGGGTTMPPPYWVRIPGSSYNDGGVTWDYDDIVSYVSLDEIRSRRGCPQNLAIVPVALPEGEEDSFYSFALQAVGGKPPYSWTVTGASGITGNSAGLLSGVINLNGATATGELSSCPPVPSIPITASVQDSGGSPPTPVTNFSVPVRPKPVTIITQSLPAAFESTAYSATIMASGGGTPYSWSIGVSPACPAGLICSGNTIAGTPTAAAAGTYTVTSMVTDSCGVSQSKSFALTVSSSGGGGGGGSCPALSLTPASGTGYAATVGTPFSQSITVSGGQSPYSNTGCTPASCNGLGLTCGASGATISGTPSAVGTCNFNVSWDDSCSTPQTISGTYSVTISPGCPGVGLSGSPPAATNCQPYSTTVTAVGGTPNYEWTITPSPITTGMTDCNGQNGASTSCGISAATFMGTPGSISFTAQVTDGCAQSASQSFSIPVNADACYANGVGVLNNTGTNYYFKRSNDAGCTLWNNGTTSAGITSATTSFSVYNHSNCNASKLVCTQAVSYCGMKTLDSNANCQVQMATPCSFSGP